MKSGYIAKNKKTKKIGIVIKCSETSLFGEADKIVHFLPVGETKPILVMQSSLDKVENNEK